MILQKFLYVFTKGQYFLDNNPDCLLNIRDQVLKIQDFQFPPLKNRYRYLKGLKTILLDFVRNKASYYLCAV